MLSSPTVHGSRPIRSLQSNEVGVGFWGFFLEEKEERSRKLREGWLSGGKEKKRKRRSEETKVLVLLSLEERFLFS